MKYREFDLPDKLLYNKDSSWVSVEGSVATIGINEPIAKSIKEFLFVKLPNVGDKLKKGSIYVSLEALKWSGHFTSPVSGEIVEVNSDLYDEPEKINDKPYDSWIMKVELGNLKEVEELFSPEEIVEWLDSVIKN